MKITHKIDKLLLQLFPDLQEEGQDKEELKTKLKDYFSYGPFAAKITIGEGEVTIELPVDNPEKEIKLYDRIVALCNKGLFKEAIHDLEELLQENPGVSEYWRIKGQIAEIEKRYDDAINDLINALKWDPTNTQALIMMGNVYSRHHRDIETALIFLKKAVELTPNDPTAINNVGGILLQEGKFEEAIPYFERAIALNPEFINPQHGLGICNEEMGDFPVAFSHFHKALLLSGSDEAMKERSTQAIHRIVNKMAETDYLEIERNKYMSYLEKLSGKSIQIVEDDHLPVMAKVLVAEVYNKPHHVLKFKKIDSTFTHLIMHELVHLDYILQARLANSNMLFTASERERLSFTTNIDNYLRKTKTNLTPETFTTKLRNILFDGLNSQIYNTPIDLFIEQFPYDQYPSLRPVQFLTINNILQVGIQAATDPGVLKSFPAPLVSKSRVLNMILALQYKELYGVDRLSEFNASTKERNQAESFYQEYLEYKGDRKPGEEYELIQNWGKDLKLDTYFKLKPDPNNGQESHIDPLDATIAEIEADPFYLDKDDQVEASINENFKESQERQGINMEVVMYMKDALEYLKSVSQDKLELIAFNIAMGGRHGYNTTSQDYRIAEIPDRTFTGYEIMAWYYVSWALYKPEVVEELGLPFVREYGMALEGG